MKALIETLGRAIVLLTLAAAASPISQATLRPVFGSIPCAVNHREALIATTIIGFTLRYFFKGLPQGRVAQCLAIWAFWIPVVQVYLFRLSDRLGPVGGPILIGFLSCHTIVIPAAYAAAESVEALDLKPTLGPYLSAILPAGLGVFYLITAERGFQDELPGLMAKSEYFNAVQLQLILGLGFISIAHSRLVILIVPPLIHTAVLNPHFHSTRTINLLNESLLAQNWTLLDRRWSNTGYISVLENLDLQYRVMRCDHSLLGGEWKATKARRFKGWKVNEPIYSVFEMLEAVRLIELDPPIVDAEARALVIGLGIGTAPKALISHGIQTTIVELDPIVHEYAKEYFALPQNHTSVTADAINWARAARASLKAVMSFDYIIHDVFTGGAEPLTLFTEEFLRNLRVLLRPNGVVAINYAGDLKAPLTTRILNTVDKVFNNSCKIYREAPPDDSDKTGIDDDFANIVIFCRNTAGPITFREPIEGDFLDSQSRVHYLLPDPKFELQFPLQDASNRTQALNVDVLRAGDEQLWASQQAESATKHWHIMRKVVPDAVWELW